MGKCGEITCKVDALGILELAWMGQSVSGRWIGGSGRTSSGTIFDGWCLAEIHVVQHIRSSCVRFLDTVLLDSARFFSIPLQSWTFRIAPPWFFPSQKIK